MGYYMGRADASQTDDGKNRKNARYGRLVCRRYTGGGMRPWNAQTRRACRHWNAATHQTCFRESLTPRNVFVIVIFCRYRGIRFRFGASGPNLHLLTGKIKCSSLGLPIQSAFFSDFHCPRSVGYIVYPYIHVSGNPNIYLILVIYIYIYIYRVATAHKLDSIAMGYALAYIGRW